MKLSTMAEDRLSEAARAFADGDVELLPAVLDEAAGAALVTLLVERGDALRLQKLGDGADKALGKRARKALHLLRTRGVAAPQAQKREFRPQGPFAPAEELSLASMIDGRGERIVWLVREVDRGFDIFEAQLSDTRGILGFTSAHAPRKDWRAHTARVVGDDRLARGADERAACARAHRGRLSAHAGGGARAARGVRASAARHGPLRARGAPSGARRGAAARSAEVRGQLGGLHALPELRTWIPPEETLPALDLEVGNIVTSKLIVDAGGRQAQLAAAVERIANAALTPEYRALLAARLYETALILAGRGKSDEARLATTAARLTLDDKVAATDNPFVLRLFDKVVKVPAEEEPSPGSASPGMLPP